MAVPIHWQLPNLNAGQSGTHFFFNVRNTALKQQKCIFTSNDFSHQQHEKLPVLWLRAAKGRGFPQCCRPWFVLPPAAPTGVDSSSYTSRPTLKTACFGSCCRETAERAGPWTPGRGRGALCWSAAVLMLRYEAWTAVTREQNDEIAGIK